MDMDAAEFGAAMQLREHLARIEQAVGIERTFQALLMRQIALVEHRSHQVALLDPDPVLAGQDAADLDAQLEDIGAKSLGALDLAGLIGIIEDQRMKVAVAGMKDGAPSNSMISSASTS